VSDFSLPKNFWEHLKHSRDKAEYIYENVESPLDFFLVDLMEQNQKIWISEDKHRTYGCKNVRDYGFTGNQRMMLDQILGQDKNVKPESDNL